jgi:hypothetical protein
MILLSREETWIGSKVQKEFFYKERYFPLE